MKKYPFFLVAGDGRTMFKSIRFFSLEEINHEILLSVIEEAKKIY